MQTSEKRIANAGFPRSPFSHIPKLQTFIFCLSGPPVLLPAPGMFVKSYIFAYLFRSSTFVVSNVSKLSDASNFSNVQLVVFRRPSMLVLAPGIFIKFDLCAYLLCHSTFIRFKSFKHTKSFRTSTLFV